MVYCTKCGKENSDEFNFCMWCGTALRTNNTNTSNEPNEGDLSAKDEINDVHNGNVNNTNYDTTIVSNPILEKPKAKRSDLTLNTIVKFVIGYLILLVVVGGIIFINTDYYKEMVKNRENKKEANSYCDGVGKYKETDIVTAIKSNDCMGYVYNLQNKLYDNTLTDSLKYATSIDYLYIASDYGVELYSDLIGKALKVNNIELAKSIDENEFYYEGYHTKLLKMYLYINKLPAYNCSNGICKMENKYDDGTFEIYTFDYNNGTFNVEYFFTFEDGALAKQIGTFDLYSYSYELKWGLRSSAVYDWSAYLNNLKTGDWSGDLFGIHTVIYEEHLNTLNPILSSSGLSIDDFNE